MAQHAKLRIDTGLTVYFCNPQSPWQRGSNENTNGLLRQYFPKGTDLSLHTALELDAVAHSLNTRPRKTVLLQNFYLHGALLSSGRNYAASASNCFLIERAFAAELMPCCLRIM